MQESQNARPALCLPIIFGNAEFIREVGIPFTELVTPGFAAAGYDVLTTPEDAMKAYPAAPHLPRAGVPIASTSHDLLIAICTLTGAKFSDAVIQALFTDVYETQVKARVQHLINVIANKRQQTPVLRFDHWFDDPGVLIRINFHLRKDTSGADLDLILILPAMERAWSHIQDHGLTHRVMTFTVQDGTLSTDMRLSEPI